MITDTEKQLMRFFAENDDKWYTHKEIIRHLGRDYNANKHRDELNRLVQADILKKKKGDKGPRNKPCQLWKTKDL